MNNECVHEIEYVGPSSAETSATRIFNWQCRLCKGSFTEAWDTQQRPIPVPWNLEAEENEQ